MAESEEAQAIQALMGVTPTGRAEQFRRAIATMPGAWNPQVSQARRDLFEPFGGKFVAGTLLNALGLGQRGGGTEVLPDATFADFLGASGIGSVGQGAREGGGWQGLQSWRPTRAGFGGAFEDILGRTRGIDLADVFGRREAWEAEDPATRGDEPTFGADVAAAEYLSDEERAESLLMSAVMAGLPPLLRPTAGRGLSTAINAFLAQNPTGNVFEKFAPLFYQGGQQPAQQGAGGLPVGTTSGGSRVANYQNDPAG